MPRGDRTGPDGFGSRTGRGAGYCSGYGRPGFMNPGSDYGYEHGYRGAGYGMGMVHHRGRIPRRGFGAFGYGWGYPAYAPIPAANPDIEGERTALEAEIEVVKLHLTRLEKVLSDLEKHRDQEEK